MNNGVEYNVSYRSPIKTVAYAYSLGAGYIWLTSFETNPVSEQLKIRNNVSLLMKGGV